MNLNQFTVKSQESIQQAQQLALGLGHQGIETGHILKGIINHDQNVTPFLFKKIGVNFSRIDQALDSIIAGYPKIEGGEQYLTKKSNLVIQKSIESLKEFKDEYVSIEHLLVGLLRAKDQVSDMLKDAGIVEAELIKAIHALRGGEKVTSNNPEETYQSLSKYANDLNALAEKGKLDPVIGRDEEIRRVLQILSRRTKNNPILIGEPGVGKNRHCRRIGSQNNSW